MHIEKLFFCGLITPSQVFSIIRTITQERVGFLVRVAPESENLTWVTPFQATKPTVPASLAISVN